MLCAEDLGGHGFLCALLEELCGVPLKHVSQDGMAGAGEGGVWSYNSGGVRFQLCKINQP